MPHRSLRFGFSRSANVREPRLGRDIQIRVDNGDLLAAKVGGGAEYLDELGAGHGCGGAAGGAAGQRRILEEAASGTTLRRIAPPLEEQPPGVYPVLREDRGFVLGGEGVHDVLAQVCNVNFAALSLDSRPLIMTLMIGVAVLIVPQRAAGEERRYRIWCDPTFGPYLGTSLGEVVNECGGRYTGVS